MTNCVTTPTNNIGRWRTAVLGETTAAEEAVSLAISHLPADIGPAVAGGYEE
ncbi:DUF6193 family natural product biosynthesis protein [Microtetraspora malaysiensis]|uniref:DUF6193 family natural product biosynthesis protein n=1 Tax=Microtetraspora malaysiensis TaxID=161358 RepID=UPI0034E2E17E